MPNAKMRLLLADDHRILRTGLKRVLDAEPDMEVVAEAGTGGEAVTLATEHQPDVVIMEVAMPDQEGLHSLREILALGKPRVAVISSNLNQRTISDAVTAGASAYLSKESMDTELISSLHTIMHGGTVFSSSVSRILAEASQRGPESMVRSVESLTDREREVFLLLADGKSPTEAASALSVSPKTIHAHRQHIKEKLGLRSNSELIRFALKEGLIKMA